MKKFLLFSAVFIFLAGFAWGQTYTWTGGGGDSDWDNTSNWDGGFFPGDGDPTYKIIIESSPHNPVFTGSALECDILTIQSSASLDMGASKLTVTSLEIENNGELKTAGDLDVGSLDNNGNLILAGSGSQTVNITTTVANEMVTYDDAGGTHFAGLTGFNHLVIMDGARTGVGDITVSGNFSLMSGSLDADSINVTGTANIIGDVTTTGGTQTYSGDVTYSGPISLTGSNINLGHINTGVGALTITGNGELHGGSNIGALTVNGNFTLTGGSLSASSVSVAGTSNISANVTTNAGNQTYGTVILDNDVILTTTIGMATLGTVTGTHSLTITGNCTFGGAVSGITSLSVSLTSAINANISTAGNQTYSGAVTLGNNITFSGAAGSTIHFGGTVNGVTTARNLIISNANVIFGGVVGSTPASFIKDVTLTAAGTVSFNANVFTTGDISIEASGEVTQTTGAITTGTLTLSGAGSYVLNSANNVQALKTTGTGPASIEYTNSASVTLGPMRAAGAIKINSGNNITVSDDITASQFIAITPGIGNVTVDGVEIHASGTGKEGIDAAIYIEASDFIVNTATKIVLSGTGGQLCLELKNKWKDTYDVVNGPEDDPPGTPDARWHQHFIDLTKDLVYGKGLPPGLTLAPNSYEIVYNNRNVTSFILTAGGNIYIYNAEITPENNSGLTFVTNGAGSIQFFGKNEFAGITLQAGTGGINLIDTDITVTGGFVLTHSEGTTLTASSPPGAGSSIKAANITLNSITTTGNKNLTLTSTSGDIIVSGQIGDASPSTASLGDVTVHSADKVTLSGAINANSIAVTSTGTTIGADITTAATQTYTGTVTLGGGVTLQGTTVTLGAITGGSHPLTITGNGVLNGGSGIGNLTVNGNFNLASGTLSAASVSVTGTSIITANITTTGTQDYKAVTLGGTGSLITLQGTTVTLGAIAGGGKSLTITGNGTFNGGTSIGDLTISVNFNLANGTLSAAKVNVTGTSNIAENITTTGTQTYTGAVTLGGEVTLQGTTVTLGAITGGSHPLTITGDGVFTGATNTIGDLLVSRNFSLTGALLNAVSVEVDGASSIAGNVTTTGGTQTYTGTVTLVGTNATRTLTGSTVTLGKIIGNGNSLTITGNGTFKNGGNGIGALIVNDGTGGDFRLENGTLNAASISVAGTSNINEDITTTGPQTYTGSATLAGSKRTITSENGNISFGSTLNSLNKIELSATSGNITIVGATTAGQLIAIASGDVSTDAITINNSNGIEGANAAIYIEADDFTPTTTTANSIVPGTSGQLCLVLSGAWTDTYSVVDGARWHEHHDDPDNISLTGMHLLYGTDDPSVTTPPLTPGSYVHFSDTNVKTTFILSPGFNVYIYNASSNNTSGLTFETKGSGTINFIGTNTFEKITVKSANGINIGSNVTAAGTQTYSGTVTLGGAVTLAGTTITLGTVVGGGNSLTITGNGVFGGAVGDVTSLSVSGTAITNSNITTTGTQDYKAVTLGGNVTLAAGTSTVTFDGAIAGGNNSLTVTGNGVFRDTVSGVTNLSVSGVNTTINGNITTTGTQTYSSTGAVTFGGNVTLQGTTVTLGAITGNNHSLTITGNGALNGDVTDINNLSVSGAATLGGTGKRTISSSGSIQFNNTLTCSNVIELSAANITIGGAVTAQRLIAKSAGTVSVNAITATVTTGSNINEGDTAAIYIEANTFVVTTTTQNSIVPGQKTSSPWGQLCLNLQNKWSGPYDVVDGSEDTSDSPPTATGFRWHQHYPGSVPAGKILYSFTEDSNGNGKLDRIRAQTNSKLSGNFSNFNVSVSGYEIDRTKGTNGYAILGTPNDDSFYIYLIEKDELDGGNLPHWSITSNTSLLDKTGAPIRDMSEIQYIDTIPPRIAYTLTLPGKTQTYVQMSEPVKPSAGLDIIASFGAPSASITASKLNSTGYLFIHSVSYGISALAQLKNIYNDTTSAAGSGYFQMNNITDNGTPATQNDGTAPKYPADWGYSSYGTSNVFIPPHRLLTVSMMTSLASGQGNTITPASNFTVTRRVTDVLVSVAPTASDDKTFVWPVFARPSGSGDTITQFDGTAGIEKSSIEKGGIELQARVSSNLTGITGNPHLRWTTADISAEYRNPQESSGNRKSGGLWLPDVSPPPSLYYYVPLSSGINTETGVNVSPQLFSYNIAANDIDMGGNAKFEFIFRYPNNSDMFIARLDGSENASNWYVLVRPFVFDIKDIRRQRGGVTIMNNVINSNNREVTYIRYHLLRSGRVTVQIYTLDGTMVKSLRRNEQREAGEWTDTWDGTNSGGRAVARGMYFVRVVGPDIDEIRKIMVVK